MQQLNRQTAKQPAVYPERILQIGGGNFMRAFADWMIDEYNEKTGAQIGVLLATAIGFDKYDDWQAQDGLYHVLTKGLQNGTVVDESHLVKSISRIIHTYPEWDTFLQSAEQEGLEIVLSNTTEAGIRFSDADKFEDAPPNEFPAKMTRWLYRRYQYFDGSEASGCIFLPVELILNNGTELKKCILQYAALWNLEADFIEWVENANTFCNTLVDRIVPGIHPDKRPAEWEELGYKDAMITQGEPFHLWVIEGPAKVKEILPLHEAGLNVIFTDDQTPYRTRKVRILNGAHTSMVPVAYLYGIDTVRETVEHDILSQYVNRVIYEEIIPTLDLPEEELIKFADDVLDRFRNPFIRHELISISLNAVSKFKARVLPSLLEYQNRKNTLPQGLVLALAALVTFYKGERGAETIKLNDSDWVIEFLNKAWAENDGSDAAFTALSEKVLSWENAWGQDLTKLPGLTAQLAGYLSQIQAQGMVATVDALVAAQ